jgi:hypothetical protein
MSIKWFKPQLHPKRNPKLVWGSFLGIGGLLYLKVWLPTTGIGIPCVFHEVTGLYCPGCGITRAALSLLELDWDQAARYNLLLLAILPMYLIYTMANKKQLHRLSRVMMTIMLTLTVAFGLLRNIPAFAWLAPIEIQ